ncbi:MAG TPA: hypothetical protein VNX17_04935 [Edaphobacter sp.]|jgi:hypothetical protein|nr:hypothetical protein [Edaphobacter sp.]
MKRLSISGPLLPWVAAPIVLSLLVALTASAQAQMADTLSQVRTIYIDTNATGPDAVEMRKHLVDSLRTNRSLEVVNDQSGADAILKTASAIWVKAYLAVNPRSPGSKYPVYGGFLSAQLLGRDEEPPWSYLVTPTRANGIRQDLADQLAKKLLSAARSRASRIRGPRRPGRHDQGRGRHLPRPPLSGVD